MVAAINLIAAPGQALDDVLAVPNADEDADLVEVKRLLEASLELPL